MPPVNPLTPTSSANIPHVSSDRPEPEDQDIWFDAIDHVEMDDTLFEGAEAFAPHEEHHTDPLSSAGEAANSLVPFTEDCRRSVQQFVRTLGEYGENKMLSACLSKILPGTPASLVLAANSLYTAVTERRNIDTAVLQALGLASGYLPENINVVSRLATFIRDTVTGWTDETFLQQFLGNEDNHTSIHLFTALAVTAIVAGRWMKDEGAPQRGALKVPAFMANIFIRASYYWTALGNMACSPPSGAEIPENTGISHHAPAFEVDTQVEMTGDVCDATASGASAPRLTAFSSNSTAHPEAYTRATVQNRPASAPGEITRIPVPEQAHYLAVEKLRQESGLSDLLYCTNLKTETCQKTNEKIITNTYFNTKCDATVYPEPLRKAVESRPVHTDRPETLVSSAATGRSGGDALIPLVITGAAVAAPVATSYIQTLKSKPAIAAGVAVGLTGAALLGGVRRYVGRNNYDEDNSNILSPISTDYSPDNLTIFNSYQIGADRAEISSDLSSTADREYYLEINFIENVVTQPLDFIPGYNKLSRVKRLTPVNNKYIPNLIIDITQDNTIDWRVRNEFDLIFRRAEFSPDVRNATSSQEKNIKLLLKVIQITQKCIDFNENNNLRHKTFESLSDILKKLWNIADNLPDPYSKEAVLEFKEHFRSYRENISSTTEPHSSTDDSHGTKASLTSSTENTANPHNEPVFIPIPEKRFNIPPDLRSRLAPADTASSVAPVDDWADVKIEKMYDFSCIDKRNNMSWTDIIRQVGKTLRSPVQSLAAESQIVHHHNTLKKGCPSEHESQHLLEVSGKIDAVLSQVMQLLPGANPVIVLQQIVGPALEIYADELDGKPLDQQKINDINQQVLFLSRQTISAQSPQGKINIYKELDSADNNYAENYFTTTEGKPAIILNGDKHELLEDNKGNPYIWVQEENGEKIKTYVRYSWKNKKWNTLGKHEEIIYSDYNKKLIQAYHAPLSSLRKGAIDFNGNIVNVIDEKGNNQEHIYMGGQFVKVAHTYINGKVYYYPLSTYLHPKVIFSDGDMAYFENINSDKSDVMNKLLEPESTLNTDEVAVAYSSDDFLFHDDFGGSYIKKDGIAYCVQDSLYKDKFIEVGDDKYVIGTTENNIDVLGKRLIGSEVFTSLHGDNQLISVSLLNKIKSKGIIYAGELHPYKFTKYGFRMKKNREYVLPVDGKFYEIKWDYRDDFQIIVKTNVSEDDIVVYMLNNAMTEARTKDIEEIETEDHNLCVNRRSPDAVSTCKKVSISSALKSILETGGEAVYIDKDMVEEDTTMPGLYKNNKDGQLFFKTNDKYYLAKKVPMEETLLKYNSFNLLRHPDNKFLCTIIYVDSVDGEVLITTEEEFYSRKALDKGLDDLKKNEKFIYPGIIYRINERLKLVKETDVDGDVRRVNRLRESIGKYFPGHEYDISRGLSYKHGSTNEFIIEGKIAAKDALIGAAEKLDANLANINQMDLKTDRGLLFRRYLEEYFGNTFGIKDKEVIDMMINRYRSVVILSRKFLRESRSNNYNNILFAATKGKKVKIDGTGYEETHTPLSDAELKIVPYMETSFEHHILPPVITVFPEKLHSYNPEHQQSYRHYPANDMTETFIHEFTHAAAVTQDYMYFKRAPDGTSINGQNLIQDFNRIISNHIYGEDLKFLLQNYFSSIAMKVPEDLNRYLASNDGLKSYLLINNAATYETLIKEFAAWKEPVHKFGSASN